jgi:hypothetical protein
MLYIGQRALAPLSPATGERGEREASAPDAAAEAGRYTVEASCFL